MLYKMTDTTDQYTRKLKYNAFMGTIAVCIIYAIVALAMILYINLTEQGKSLYSDLKPFALTFIFGTLFIIMTVTLMVVYWEPEQEIKQSFKLP
jgi:magnesium-transporting ATPase (P-type)